MTESERTEAIEEMTDVLIGEERYEDLIPTMVEIAKAAVVVRLFPFDDEAAYENVPRKWDARVAEIAAFLIDKRGAEGEIMHTENGTTRMYKEDGIPSSYFVGMAPYVGVPR